ncbi:glycosyltransferase family 4 protein [Psychroflexus planctonicus]|nr:glycosyltransferase family 4 protein [Psychroflexus planctonicus]
MKVAIITSKYPSKKFPYRHMFVHIRVKKMIELGVDVQVLVCTNKELSYSFEGVNVHQYNNTSIIKQLSSFDVVYLHLLNLYPLQKADGWPIYQHIMQNKIPFCMYVHGNEVQKYTARKYEYNYSLKETLKWLKKDLWVIPKMKKFVESAILLSYGKFIFPSKWMHQETQRNLDVKIKKPIFIPNGINTDFYSYQDTSQNRYKLISIRPFSAQVYHIEKTIEVMEHLPKKYTLSLFGQGKYLKVYKKLIKKKKLSKRVKIIEEFLQPKEMLEQYRKHGIFISTTRQDSQGLTILEAMSSGLLGVSTLNTAKPEFITHKETGVLANTPEEIALHVKNITTEQIEFNTFTRKASHKIQNLRIKDKVSEEIEILEKVGKRLL